MNRQQRRARQKKSASPAATVMTAALRAHAEGRLLEAGALCQQMLQTDPRHADSLHLLGVMALQDGQAERAIELIGQAISIAPGLGVYHCNLGNAQAAAKQLIQARASYQQALQLLPMLHMARNNLGNVLLELGEIEAAIACFREVAKQQPESANAHNNLGIALHNNQQSEEALVSYRRALALTPDAADVHNNLGTALQACRQLLEAVSCYRMALALKPDFPEALNNLGVMLKEAQKLDGAMLCYRRALELQPQYASAHSNLGTALHAAGQLEEAMACYRRAVELHPNFVNAHNNLGVLLHEMRRLDESVASYQRALALNPDYADAHHHLGLVLLAKGELAAAWPEYEWRWKTAQLRDTTRCFDQPQWRGEAAAGQTLLIHDEQGFGDTLQFCRYASLAAARGMRVIFLVPRPLARLLRSLLGVSQVLSHGSMLPPFDLHCPMMSLPMAFGTTLDSIPAVTPYLWADDVHIMLWQQRLAAMSRPGLRVGLVWAGNPRPHLPNAAAIDRRRSMPAGLLAALFAVPDVHFVSLQKDVPPPEGVELTDMMADIDDFAETAGLISNLDLVISVDTAVAHLAGALGKPVWLLDRFDACWRWMDGRTDSPWYPGLRIYRQTQAGDWAGVLEQVVRDLSALSSQAAPPNG